MPAIRSVAILAISMAAGGAMALATRVLFGRALTVEQFGDLWAALSAVGLLVPLSTFGVGQLWILTYSEEGPKARRWFKPSVVLMVTASVAAIGLLATWGVFRDPRTEYRWLPLLVSPILLVYTIESLASSRFQLEERFVAVAGVQNADKIAVFTVAVLTSSLGWGLGPTGLAILIVGTWAAFLLAPTILVVARGRLRLPPALAARPADGAHQTPTALAAARRAWPYAFAAVSYSVFQQIDVVLLSWLASNEAAGIYAASVTFVLAVYLLPAAVDRYLVPKFYRWAETDRPRLGHVYGVVSRGMVGSGLLIALVLFAAAGWVVPLVFGSEYQSAVTQLRILSLGIPFRFASAPASVVLLTRRNAYRRFNIQLLAAAGNLLLNLGLIPVLGITGASVTTVVSEIALAIGFTLAARTDLSDVRAPALRRHP